MEVDANAKHDKFTVGRKMTSKILLTIGGLPSSVKAPELIQILQQHSGVEFNVVSFDSHETGPNSKKITLTLDNREHADRLKSLCGIELPYGRIWILERSPSKAKKDQRLEETIAAGYLRNDNFIDLKEIYQTHKLDLNRKQTVKFVFETIKRLFPHVIGLNLSSNSIHDLFAINEYLSQTLPQVINLGLENNQIKKVGQIDKLKGSNIRNLILSNNPLCASLPNYRREVSTRLPNLETLDTKDVTVDRIDAPVSFYFENPAFEKFAVGFVMRYVSLFDGARMGLVPLYGSESMFSVSCSEPYGTKSAGTIYQQLDRNLVLGIEKEQNLAIGEGIITLLNQLPATLHDSETFRVEVLRTSIGISVTLHGRMKDDSLKRELSFDHVLHLIPAPEGSPAKSDGWEAVIANEQLHVRI